MIDSGQNITADLDIEPLLSPISSPPSPFAYRANVSNYLPFTHLDDDKEAEDNNDHDDEKENEPQNIEVLTGQRNNRAWARTVPLPQGWTHTASDNKHNYPQGWNTRISNNNTAVVRNNRCLLARQLPTIFVTNHRWFFPKLRNFLEFMKTYELTLGIHSEIWEVKEKKQHQNKIEEALELEGVKYISNPRPDRRGGGAAITLIEGDFTLTKLEIGIPKGLEVVWGIVKP